MNIDAIIEIKKVATETTLGVTDGHTRRIEFDKELEIGLLMYFDTQPSVDLLSISAMTTNQCVIDRYFRNYSLS